MTSVQRRRQPLHAEPVDADESLSTHGDHQVVAPPPPPPAPSANPALPPPPGAPTLAADDRMTFVEGVHELKTSSSRFALGERTLMLAGGIVAPLGILVVILGWVGAARTPLLFEQIPYLISGGLLGLALVFLGSFFYFAHWITQLVKEHRTQSTAIIAALGLLQASVDAAADRPIVSRGTADDDHWGVDAGAETVVLVATARGSMAHRESCAVVAGKDDLRVVSGDESLAPCKMCEPYPDR